MTSDAADIGLFVDGSRRSALRGCRVASWAVVRTDSFSSFMCLRTAVGAAPTDRLPDGVARDGEDYAGPNGCEA